MGADDGSEEAVLPTKEELILFFTYGRQTRKALVAALPLNEAALLALFRKKFADDDDACTATVTFHIKDQRYKVMHQVRLCEQSTASNVSTTVRFGSLSKCMHSTTAVYLSQHKSTIPHRINTRNHSHTLPRSTNSWRNILN
jgi:hypothetical protein